MNSLSKRLYTARGHHLFKNVLQIPNLDKVDRVELIKQLCSDSTCLKLCKNIDWEDLAGITEGYHVGDIKKFVDRAIFFAIKESMSF